MGDMTEPIAPVEHRYLSTACLHGIHEHCQAKVNLEGEPKLPGTCKWCGSRCVCDYVAPDGTPCHPLGIES